MLYILEQLCQQLKILNLRFNQISDIKTISQTKFEKLHILDIKNNKINKKANSEIITNIRLSLLDTLLS